MAIGRVYGLMVGAGLLLMSVGAIAQSVKNPLDSIRRRGESGYGLSVQWGVGISQYSAPIGIPPGLDGPVRSRLGYPATVRVLFHTDHRLRVGIETGYTRMYQYKATIAGEPTKVTVGAYPLLIVFSMPIARRFAIFAGAGPYIVTSRLEYGTTIREKTASLGWVAAGSYAQPITRNLDLGAELKWFDATQTNDACFVLQANLVWRALRW